MRIGRRVLEKENVGFAVKSCELGEEGRRRLRAGRQFPGDFQSRDRVRRRQLQRERVCELLDLIRVCRLGRDKMVACDPEPDPSVLPARACAKRGEKGEF